MNRNNYNLIAPIYNIIARIVFLNRINKSQLVLLPKLKEQAKILYIGGGTGIILNQLIELNPKSKITYLEKSEAMVNLAKKRSNKPDQINFVVGTEKDLKEENYDTIITNFFLDQFNDSNQYEIFNSINSKLNRGGIWLICDFNQASKWWQTAIEQAMFIFLRLTTNIESDKIPPIKNLFRNENFKKLEEKKFFKNFIFSQLYKKL